MSSSQGTEKMRFIMTGHKGLIGNSLLERLTREGHEPALLVDARAGGDIRKIREMQNGEPIDLMIHLASYCRIEDIRRDPNLALQHNVIGTHEVMEFCKERAVPKVVFSSSSRVLSPERNPYTASKIYGEELARGYHGAYCINFVIVRPSAVYGPFNDLSERLVDKFIIAALKGEPLVVKGDRNKTLDFTYVDDFVDGMMIAMDQKNEDFDIAGGTEVRVGYVAELVKSLTGSGSAIRHESPDIAQPQQVCIDISKLKQLGYNPKVSIEEGIERCVRWYRDNFDEILRSR
jgi:nucleoside-diphosphate-sugar epimerase